MSESKYNLRSCKHLDYAMIHILGKVYKSRHTDFLLTLVLSQRQLETSCFATQAHDFAEMKCLLEEEKETNKALGKSSQLNQMRKELEVLRLRNAMLEKHTKEDQKKTMLKDLRTNPLVSFKVEQFLSQLDDSKCEDSEDDDKTEKNSTRGRRHILRLWKASK